MRDQNTYTHEDNERFLARLPAAIAEEVRNSPLGYAWPIDGQFRVLTGCTASGMGAGDDRESYWLRIGLRPVRATCAGAAAGWQTSTARRSPPTRWRPAPS